MSPLDALVLVAAAALAGALNSVVGGGSFVAFPALLLVGVAPVSANATTALALWPGSLASTVAYRRELRQPPRAVLAALIGASAVGGTLGALLLLRTPNATFIRLIPWLLLLASALFTFGGPAMARLAARAGSDRHPASPSQSGPTSAPGGKLVLVAAALTQLAIATYGGYFGGGMGIMMLAVWSTLGMTDIHRMNGLRVLVALVINGVALVAFIAAHAIAWTAALPMMVAATATGWFGAAVARRVAPRHVRRFVIAVAWSMTAYFFLHHP
jgi:uncharacterized membrane protein YfcA